MLRWLPLPRTRKCEPLSDTMGSWETGMIAFLREEYLATWTRRRISWVGCTEATQSLLFQLAVLLHRAV